MEKQMLGINPVKFFREKNKESQAELAAFAGVTQQHIGFIEQGKRTLQYDQALKLAEHWHIRVFDLLGYVITDSEKESWILETYRAASQEVKNIVDGALRLVDIQNETKKTN